MIEVNNLVKRYGKHCAVDHLSFTVEEGLIYGFLGPNGAGKSTTMNIITGYIGASEGQVLVNGHDILKEPEKAKRGIGYLPEIPPLYPDMTVEEYLLFVMELKAVARQERSAQLQKLVEMTGLEEVQWRLIRNLSKGYRQRVGLAQALVGFPKLVILDEPMVGLDPKQIAEIRELIRSLAGRHTVFFSSHILSQVQELCDRVLIIDRGRLVAFDSPEKLEQHLGGGRSLQLEVKGSAQAVEAALQELAVTVDRLEEDGESVKLTLRCRQEQDLREELFYAFTQAGCPILSMSEKTGSLEDIFLQMTEKEDEE